MKQGTIIISAPVSKDSCYTKNCSVS